MLNISGFGAQVRLTASNTLPDGITLSQFAHDADPFDVPELTIGDSGMSINGIMTVWNRPTPFEFQLNLIATSDDDNAIADLFEANRVGYGKRGARDIITISALYPSGAIATLNQGFCLSGNMLPSIANAGHFKSKSYRWRFENATKTGF